MATDAINHFLHDLFPPYPRSAAFVEMCDNMNRVEELPAFRKRREFMEKISVAWFVPTTATGSRLLDKVPPIEHARYTIEKFANALFYR